MLQKKHVCPSPIEVMVKQQEGVLNVDLQRIQRFLEMRALPRCAAESSICSINYNSPPPPSPVLRHLFPFNGTTIRE